MIELLRNRFGNVGQAERFRAELRVRRRQPGETLQQLYQDIRRLVSLAYPGPTSGVFNIVARDSFLDALDDDAFRIRILEKEPVTLDAALQIAVKLEAYDGGRIEQARAGADRAQRPKEHYSRVVTEGKSQSAFSESVCSDLGEEGIFKHFGDSMRGCISQMAAFQSEMENQRKRLQQGDPAKSKYRGYKRNGSALSQGMQGRSSNDSWWRSAHSAALSAKVSRQQAVFG